MTSSSYSSLKHRNSCKCFRVWIYILLILALFITFFAFGIFGAHFYHQYFLGIHHPVNEANIETDNNKNNYNGNVNNNNGDNENTKESEIVSGHKNSGMTLVFEDNFDTLDLARWKHEITAGGGGNWEFEYYTNNRSNSYVRDGVLYIKPTLTNNTYTAPNYLTSGTLDLWGSIPADVCTSNAYWGCERTGTGTNVLNPVQSARLRTAESFSFTYGKVEVGVELPKGDWLWPAVWLLPRDNYYGKWPASGEIDIIEARGNYHLECTNPNYIDGSKLGVHQAGTTIHWGPYYGTDRFPMTHANITLPNMEKFCDGFHNWTMVWNETGFWFYFDSSEIPYMMINITEVGGLWKYGNFDSDFPNSFNPWSETTGNATMNAPFDREFFFVLNLAVGGASGFFPDGCTSYPDGNLPSYPKPWSDTSSTAYQDFWNDVDLWYPTWYPFENNGESAALKIDYIRVYQYN